VGDLTFKFDLDKMCAAIATKRDSIAKAYGIGSPADDPREFIGQILVELDQKASDDIFAFEWDARAVFRAAVRSIGEQLHRLGLSASLDRTESPSCSPPREQR
jgi:hypothetical protein